MCGLAGFITHQNAKLGKKQQAERANIFKGLLIAMQDRGTHSTGIAGMVKDDYCMLKQAVSAKEFVESDKFNEYMALNPRYIIGHTRFATVGAITSENAHPFLQGNIMGTHNGHVTNHKEVFPDGDVDSQAIFQALDDEDNDFTKAFPKLKGQFALTWFDIRERDRVYICLSGNPLSIIRIPELKTYFWTSTLYALQAVVGSHFDLKDKEIWTPKTDNVYEITTQFQIEKTPIEFMKYTSNYGKGQYSSYSRDTWEKELDDKDEEDILDYEKYLPSGKIATCLVGAECKIHNEEAQTNLHEITEGYDKDDGSMAWRTTDEYDWKEIRLMKIAVQEGCSWCTQPIDFDRDDGFFWGLDTQVVICYNCSDEIQEWSGYEVIDEMFYEELLDDLNAYAQQQLAK